VFVSSTVVDLSEERLEVMKALLELDCIPCGMEYFPAASEESWTYIASLIDKCDYYVVIVGGRYGSMTNDGISFTQKEYLYAQSKGIPCLAFIHAHPEELPVKKTEPTEEGKARLAEFVAHLRKNPCKEWSSVHELGAVVSRSVTQLMKRHPRTGWIPANQAGDPKTTEELLTLTRKVAELEEELRKARGRPALDVSVLADGDDEVELNITYAVSVENTSGTWPRSEIVARENGAAVVTWTDLFRTIAPRIAPFASDAQVRSRINAFLKDRFTAPKGVLKDGEWVSSVALVEDAFNLIRVQFLALGLMIISREQQADGQMTEVRWRLTEEGLARMNHALAMRKPPPSSKGTRRRRPRAN
jgi:hypothetical protein